MAKKRLFFLCSLIGFLAVIDIAKPIDIALESFANKMLAREVSGDIVKISYDGSQMSRFEAAETILDAGADGVLTTSLTDLSEQPFVHTIAVNYHTQKRFEPTTFDLHIEWWRGVEFVKDVGNKTSPVELLANTRAATGQQTMRIDYSFAQSTIPVYSFETIVAGIENLSGKQAVLVDESRPGPEFNIPGNPAASASTVLVLAAETLSQNSLSTIPSYAFVIIFVLICYCALARRKTSILVAVTTLAFIIVAVFLALRSIGIYSGMGIAIVAIALIGTHISNRRKREKSFDSCFRHHSALTERLTHMDADIVAARIKSYRSFRHGTDPKHTAVFVREVERRLSVAAAGSEIFELEAGVFAWSMRMSDEEELQNHLEAARLILKEPVMLGDRQLSLSVAFGLEVDRERLLDNRFGSALLASHDAERDGLAFKRSNYEEVAAHREDLLLIGELEDAIKADQIYPVFQPKVCLETLKVIGFEALARWNHPKRGMISPATFVPLVEGHGKACVLARHMLIKSLKIWAELQMTVPLSVNISPTSLMSDNFVGDVQNALNQAALPSSMLVLEIIETEALSNNDNTEPRLRELCDLGIELSIDDFGTGYSTLDNVRRLPAKELKLDKKFIDDIGTSDVSERLVSTTYKLGAELGLSVVAEGIETLEQLAKLQSIGIQVGQGYYFAKPMKADDVKAYLSSVFRHSQTA